MRLVQYRGSDGKRGVAATDHGRRGPSPLRVADAETVYELALEAIERDARLADVVLEHLGSDKVDLDAAYTEGRLLAPIDHPVPTRFWVTGTGLTHLGSAETRDRMHTEPAAGEAALTDSMRMFRANVEGGKPAVGVPVQPEWFYKGDGRAVIAPGHPLPQPEFALGGGEEPEVVGLYVIAEDGTPCRVGFALGNDFTDHDLERRNYLYLAHAKLRACALGPELLLGPLPDTVEGTSRIIRDGRTLWEAPFVSGEANMTHTVAGLEHHHFKYASFRRGGDVHAHFFGTSTLSALSGVRAQPGDQFEISAPLFGRPLRNPIARVPSAVPAVRVL